MLDIKNAGVALAVISTIGTSFLMGMLWSRINHIENSVEVLENISENQD